MLKHGDFLWKNMIKIEIERKSEKVITNLCHFVYVYCINELQIGSYNDDDVMMKIIINN